MSTQKLGLPLISGNLTANIPRDMNALAEAVDAKAGVAGGLATLGAGGKVPANQLDISTDGLVTEGEFTTHLADYMYQIPTIVGTQIRINRLSDTNRLFFKLDSDLTGDITISTDGGTTEKPLVDFDQTSITQLEKGFVEVVADASFFILRNRGISGADRQALIDIVNEAERNESDLKTQFVDTVNDKTGSELQNDATWFDVKNAISNMTNKKWTSGSAVVQSAPSSQYFYNTSGSILNISGGGFLEVTGLDFTPSFIIAFKGMIDNVGIVIKDIENGAYSISRWTSLNFEVDMNRSPAYLNNGFKMPTSGVNGQLYNWIAFE